MIKIGIYQKMIEESISHSPLEAELARQIDKLNARLDAQHHVIQTLTDIMKVKV